MKKIAFAVAAAGLFSLAACNSQQAENAEQNAEMRADNLHDAADNLIHLVLARTSPKPAPLAGGRGRPTVATGHLCPYLLPL